MLVAGSTVLSALYYQNTFCTILLSGAICNSLMGKVWKVVIGSKRPTKSSKLFNSYGMPSSHSNSLFYFVSFLGFTVFDQYDYIPASLACTGFASYALTVCYYRVYVSHDHTVKQIIAGMMHGLFMGGVAYNVVLTHFSK